MKQKKNAFLTLVMLLGLITGSCRRVSDMTDNPIIVPAPTRTVNQTAPAPVPSTTVPRLSPTASPQPTRSPTPTAFPTLGVDEARLNLLDLLANNGNCRLPCFWGITPGETTSQKAQDVLTPLGSLSYMNGFTPSSGTVDLNYSLENDVTINMEVLFLVKRNVVDSIGFHGRISEWLPEEREYKSIYDSVVFGEHLSHYMLPGILSTQGRPDAVFLFTFGEFPPWNYGQGHFQIILLYPEQGILVHYTTEMQITGENITGCLQNAHVQLDLYPSGDSRNFYKQLERDGWTREISSYIPLEEATSLNLDEFYEAFLRTSDTCLVTPASIWMIPEP
jgi:hypothetical protein